VKNNVLVIINHNDAMSEDELKKISSKTDNDKNTLYISEIVMKYEEEVGIKI